MPKRGENGENGSACEPAFYLKDLEAGEIAIDPGWLKEIWGKWPGDEPIEELLAVLANESST